MVKRETEGMSWSVGEDTPEARRKKDEINVSQKGTRKIKGKGEKRRNMRRQTKVRGNECVTKRYKENKRAWGNKKRRNMRRQTEVEMNV